MNPSFANHKLKTFFSWERVVIAILLVLGALLRLRQYLTDRSLWVDEAMLALNILHRNFAGLLQQPMEYGQSAPIGYVFSVKAFTLFLGDSEYALRFFSLLAGCLALFLIAIISGQYLEKPEAVIAVAMFACAPYLVYYTSETKQYIGDVLVSLLLLFLFFRIIQRPATARDFLLLSVVGTILLWFSHPVGFVAASVGLTLFIHYWINKDRMRLLWTALCGAVWVLSLGILYFVNLRHLAASELLLNYWQNGFMQLPPWSNLTWFGNIWNLLLNDPLSLHANPLIVFIIFIAGVMFLSRRDWRMGAVILLPLVLALIASAFHKYSLLGRMLLFAIPLFIIALASGVNAFASLVRNQYLSHGLRILLAVYLMWGPISVSFAEFMEPKTREHIKPSMEYLRDRSKPDDTIYVYYNAGPAFRYYAPRYALTLDNVMIGRDHSADPQAYYAELNQLDDRKRVWFIFSHVYERDDFNEREFILDYVDQLGEKVREYRVPATSVYLYLYDLK